MAEREVRDLIRPQEPKRVKIEDIQRVVARQYNVSRADLLSSRRTANVVRPRQVAMYLAKTLTLRSLPEIGRRFGGRDHTTVLHAVRKIETLVNTDTALAEEIEIAQAPIAGVGILPAREREWIADWTRCEQLSLETPVASCSRLWRAKKRTGPGRDQATLQAAKSVGK